MAAFIDTKRDIYYQAAKLIAFFARVRVDGIRRNTKID